MKAFWAKITAWFMAIIAFFTGLFSAGNQPPEEPKPEPTSEVIVMPTEPTSNPATEPAVPAVLPRIVTTTDVFETGYDAITTIDRLAGLGYEGIDMGFDYWTFSGSPFGADDYLGWAQSLRTHADAVGIPYTHAHAPADAGNAYWLERSIRASQVIGARYCVVHPVYTKDGSTITDKDTFVELNADLIRKMLPLAEACGVVLLSENILWGASADPRIIADLVKAVDSPFFGWCFDTGHAHCKGFGPQILTECSVVPLSLHIQDSVGGDDHLIPGDGNIDWDAFTRTLHTVGYTGDCVLEAHHQSLYAADSERDAILARLLQQGKTLQQAMAYTA